MNSSWHKKDWGKWWSREQI